MFFSFIHFEKYFLMMIFDGQLTMIELGRREIEFYY